MKKFPDSLFLNGNYYQGKTLIDFANTIANTSTWQHNIGLFLLEWLDNKEYIKVNTSGSTGHPKIIHLSKNLLLASAQNTINYFSLSQDSKAFMCLPAKYIAGKMMLVRAMVGKWNLTTVEPNTNPLLNYDGKTDFDFAAFTPMQLHEILLHNKSKLKINNFNKIIIGGSSISDKLLIQIKDLSPTFYETYGMTETASHIAIKQLNKKNSINNFSAVNGVTFATDNRDCLVIHWEKFLGNALITNDVVNLVDNQHFYWIGRIDNVINSGGIKLFAENIENKIKGILNTPFYISFKYDEKFGQFIVLMIEEKQLTEIQQKDILKQCSQILEKYEIPKEIICVRKFNRTETGKIIRSFGKEIY